MFGERNVETYVDHRERFRDRLLKQLNEFCIQRLRVQLTDSKNPRGRRRESRKRVPNSLKGRLGSLPYFLPAFRRGHVSEGVPESREFQHPRFGLTCRVTSVRDYLQR